MGKLSANRVLVRPSRLVYSSANLLIIRGRLAIRYPLVGEIGRDRLETELMAHERADHFRY